MPDGQPAPVTHQHADDTTIHVLRPSDAQVALDSSIALFCAATCSQLNVSKSRAFLIQAQPLASGSVAALPSISFITCQQTIKHLGVLLGYDMQAASHQQFTGIYHAISAKVRRSWPVISGQSACGQAGPSCLAVVSCQLPTALRTVALTAQPTATQVCGISSASQPQR